jgi:hypothetical protein
MPATRMDLRKWAQMRFIKVENRRASDLTTEDKKLVKAINDGKQVYPRK